MLRPSSKLASLTVLQLLVSCMGAKKSLAVPRSPTSGMKPSSLPPDGEAQNGGSLAQNAVSPGDTASRLGPISVPRVAHPTGQQPGWSAPHMVMEPATLSFKAHPLCIPAVENTEVVNIAEKDDLQIISVSADNVHFHPSLVQQTTLRPGGRLSLSIVFLPRIIGEVEGTVVVNTSAGNFMYHVKAEGVANAYEVRPFLAAKVPTGTWYSPSISVYNPHDSILHVKEIYTSESFLHLNLPQSSEKDLEKGQRKLWQV